MERPYEHCELCGSREIECEPIGLNDERPGHYVECQTCWAIYTSYTDNRTPRLKVHTEPTTILSVCDFMEVINGR